MTKLERSYDRLTGDERFRLIIAALARGDEAEFTSLAETCPSFAYRMRDWECFGRFNASLHVVASLALDLAPRLHSIRLLDTQDRLLELTFEMVKEQAIRSWMAGFKLAGGDVKALEAFSDDTEAAPSDLERSFLEAGTGTEEIALCLRQHLSQVREEKLQAIASTVAGFDAFAKEAWGIDAAEVIKAHSGMLEDLSPYLKEIGEVPVAEDTVRSNTASFECLWRSFVHRETETGST
jgi:hypothetical protein